MPFRTGRMAVSAPYRRRDVLHRGVKRIRLHGEEDEVVGAIQVAGLDRARIEVSIAMQAVDVQSEMRDLLGPAMPDKEGHVASGFDQPAAEIAAQRSCADHQDPHDLLLDVQADGFLDG